MFTGTRKENITVIRFIDGCRRNLWCQLKKSKMICLYDTKLKDAKEK